MPHCTENLWWKIDTLRCPVYYVTKYWSVRKISKSDCEHRHVGLSAWNYSAPTTRIFLKPYIYIYFFLNLLRNFTFYQNLTGLTVRYVERMSFVIISRWNVFRMRNVLGKSCKESPPSATTCPLKLHGLKKFGYPCSRT